MTKRNTQGKRRRRGARLTVCLLLLAVAFVWWGNTDLMTERFSFVSARVPSAFEGYRIVHLSDLHNAVFGEDNERLFAAVAEEKPDLIVITGDLLDRFRGMDPVYIDTIGRGLTDIAPTYFVTGNHEWAVGGVWAVKAHLEATGIHVLSNEYVPLQRNGETIYLAGIDDPNGFADQKSPEMLAQELHANEGEDVFWLLLAHRNDHFAEEYCRLGADLTLSGHGHGGVIRLPFTDGLLSTDRTFFASYSAGFYTAGEENARVFVSRGLGNSGPMLRLFNRPELAVLTLTRQESQ